jgi:mRNA-degrading endonuclease RelE of RelBE toxin-antitoxin system
MAGPFEINITKGAEDDLAWLRAYARRVILDGLEVHLRHEPMVGSRKIRKMRPNPVAGWELKLGDFRVLYDIAEEQRVVTVQVVGEKRGNRLIVQGQEFTEHESN